MYNITWNSSLEGGLVCQRLWFMKKRVLKMPYVVLNAMFQDLVTYKRRKKRQYYLKPSDVRKQKRQEARKKYK